MNNHKTDVAAIDGTGIDAPVDDVERWRFTDLARIVATYVLLVLIVRTTLQFAGAAVGVEFVTSDHLPRSNAAHVGDIARLLCYPLAIWWTVGRPASPRRRTLGLTRPKSKHGVVAAVVLCTLLIAVKVPLAFHIGEFGALPVSFAQDPQLLAAAPETLRGWGLMVSLLSIGPLVAIAEELVYRGALFAWLRGRLRVIGAVLISSLVFAATHGLEGAAFAFVSGLVLAWLYHRSDSLWPGIAVHAVTNMTTLLILAAAT